MTANVKEGKLIYLMKKSSFFVLFLINLASDQLLLLFLLMSAFIWHSREFSSVCVYTHICTVCVIPTFFLYFTVSVPGSQQILCYFYFRTIS